MYDGTVNANKTSAAPGQCDGGSSGAGDGVMTVTMTMTMTMPSGTYVYKTMLPHLMW